MPYQAIIVPECNDLPEKEMVDLLQLLKNFERWGRLGDHCLIAVREDEKIGAGWCGIHTTKHQSYGYFDDRIPELTIVLKKEFRNMDIGYRLINNPLRLLRDNGYKAVSLSMDIRNPAVNFYKQNGFTILNEMDQSYTMIKYFDNL